MALATYIPEDVSCIIAGIINVEGYVDGTFITIDKGVPPYTTTITPDGTIARTQNGDTTYTVSITIQAASTTNDVLTKLHQLDQLTNMGKVPLFIKDRSGSDLFFAATAWIEGLPSMSKSNGADERTWTFRAAAPSVNFGNNEEACDLVQDIINLATGALPSLGGLL
jgi:hypothetical protein